MNYLVAVLSDRIKAEAAYSALEQAALPMDQIAILGQGYQNADQFGLIDPNQEASKRSGQLAYWLVPFGFAAGYLFNLLTGIEIFGWAGQFGNHIIGGILGAASGALGALFVGGGIGLTTSSGDALVYRNRLDAGKYLIVAKGDEAVVRDATQVLRQFDPENMQGYVEPVSSL